jgi:hypothetical protein
VGCGGLGLAHGLILLNKPAATPAAD